MRGDGLLDGGEGFKDSGVKVVLGGLKRLRIPWGTSMRAEGGKVSGCLLA